jgi:ankyrin repeat protein
MNTRDYADFPPTNLNRMLRRRLRHDPDLALYSYYMWPDDETEPADRHDVLKVLLEHGADLTTRDKGGFTPLIRAVSHKQLGYVVLLIQHRADVNATDINDRTALHWAAQSGSAPCIDLILPHAANINVPDDTSVTPLMWAAQCGETEAVRALLDAHADVNLRNSRGETAIDMAYSDFTETIALLRKYGAMSAKELSNAKR